VAYACWENNVNTLINNDKKHQKAGWIYQGMGGK
jgi:hypothetical protein